MKLGLRAVVVILLTIVGLETVAERLDLTTLLAGPAQQTEKAGANGVGQ